MKKKLCTAFLLNSNVDVYLVSGEKSSFTTQPSETALPEICVSAECNNTKEIFEALLHEVFEFLMTLNGYRYKVTETYFNYSDLTFIFNHNQFTQMCVHSSRFITDVFPVLIDAWKLEKKKEEAKKKAKKK